MGDLLGKRKKYVKKTDLEEIQEMQVVLGHVDVSPELYERIGFYAEHCPRLWSMLQKGISGYKRQEALFKPITVTFDGTYYLRHYIYESFRDDYMLAQLFNLNTEFFMMQIIQTG